MNILTPQQHHVLADGLDGLLALRETALLPLPRPPRSLRRPSWDPTPEQHEEELLSLLAIPQKPDGPDYDDERLVHGVRRQDLLSWLTAQTLIGSFANAVRHTLDDITYDDSPAKVLRVLREEGFTETARIPDYRGRDLRLLIHPRGWLAQVKISHRRTTPTARAYLSINAYAVDHELVFAAAEGWNLVHRIDERTSLLYGTVLINRIGLRVVTAVLRAFTLPVTPWRVPALRDWLAGEPPLLPGDDNQTASACLAVAETLTILTSLPPPVRALIASNLATRS